MLDEPKLVDDGLAAGDTDKVIAADMEIDCDAVHGFKNAATLW